MNYSFFLSIYEGGPEGPVQSKRRLLKLFPFVTTFAQGNSTEFWIYVYVKLVYRSAFTGNKY